MMEFNKFQVFVERFPELGDRHRVSVNGGSVPQWSPDGRELYFLADDGSLVAVPIETEPRFEAGAPRVLIEGRYLPWWGVVRPYSVAPDGSHFVMIRVDDSPAPATPGPVIVYMQNWADELAR